MFFFWVPYSDKSILANGFKNQTLTFPLFRKLTLTFHFAHRPGKSHFFVQESKTHCSRRYVLIAARFVKKGRLFTLNAQMKELTEGRRGEEGGFGLDCTESF